NGKTNHDPAELAAARAALRRALDADPGLAASWDRLAEAELNAGQLGRARRHFEGALERNPVSIRALDGLAQVAIAQKRPKEAAEFIRRSLAIEPNQPRLRDVLEQIES